MKTSIKKAIKVSLFFVIAIEVIYWTPYYLASVSPELVVSALNRQPTPALREAMKSCLKDQMWDSFNGSTQSLTRLDLNWCAADAEDYVAAKDQSIALDSQEQNSR